GYDIFAFESRGQGQSQAQEGYEPLQWVTDFDVCDMRTAVAYLKSRPDADPRGIGVFGLSKGGSTALYVAASEPYLRCFVTDGIFDSLTTMIPYMKQWILIYTKKVWIVRLLPTWYYHHVALLALKEISAVRKVHYVFLEDAMPKLSPRPFFMIHGGADNY